MSAGQLECRQVVIKDGPSPGSGAVTGRTVAAHGTLMDVASRMAANTGGGCTLVYIIDMAGLACHAHVRTRQLKGRQVVIIFRPGPGAGGMAAGAVGTHGTLVHIASRMTANTGGDCALVHVIDMTGLAGHAHVRTGQLKGRQIVIIFRPGPGAGGMAAGAVGSHGSLVHITGRVAANTGGGCTLVDIVDMALAAQRIHMRTGQLKNGQVVIKVGACPGRGRMAITTNLAHRTLMLVVCLVAGIAGGGCPLVNIINMASDTQCTNMRTG